VNLNGMNISAEFSQLSTCGATIDPGQSCSIDVTLEPRTGGAKTGTLTIAHGGNPSSDTVSMSGNGVVVYHHINTITQYNDRGALIGGGDVQHGAYVTVVAVANPGFDFVNWNDNEGTVSTNPTYSFRALSDMILTASFTPQLIIDTDGDGSPDNVDPDDDNDGIADGSDIAPFNPRICVDIDGDTCDDCSGNPVSVASGSPWALYTPDPINDGTDTDGDGICDLSYSISFPWIMFLPTITR